MQTQSKSSSLDFLGRLVGLLILLGACTYWFSGRHAEPLIKLSGDEKAASVTSTQQIQPQSVSSSASTAMNSGSKKEASLIQADIAEHGEWLKTMGYRSQEEKDNYSFYDDNIIKDLAKNNDVIAITILAKKAMTDHNFPLAQKYYWQAAAVGSTPALDQLALLAEPSPEFKGDVVYGKPKLLEQLAVYKVAEMRGDSQIARIGTAESHKIYERYFGDSRLTSGEEQQVNRLADELYEKLQAERTRLGLGSFENSTSKLVQTLEEK